MISTSIDFTRRQWLACLGALALPAAARPGPALMLAREADADIDPRGWLVSEKFDGTRAHWDGRQLRFRSGLDVPAPEWFLARLPAQALDGELWLGRGRFDELSGIVRKRHPDDAKWRSVRYLVFDLPGAPGPFAARAARIETLVRDVAWPQLKAVAQEPLADRAALARRLDDVVRAGGEGLVLHRADASWQAGRSDSLLKLKPVHDAEAVVLGHVRGHGRNEGRLGALRVRNDAGVVFDVGTGLSDAERDRPPPVGMRITYTYRGTTPAGVPRFASFLRVRAEP